MLQKYCLTLLVRVWQVPLPTAFTCMGIQERQQILLLTRARHRSFKCSHRTEITRSALPCVLDCRETRGAAATKQAMASSQSFTTFEQNHLDVVLAVDFNFYGTRMATGSADHRVKVYDRKEDNWSLVDTFGAHDAEITDVCLYFISVLLMTSHCSFAMIGKETDDW